MKYSSRELLGYAVLTLSLQLNGCVEGDASCKDIQGRSYETGIHYIPGPEPCTLCVCDNGNPKWCKAVICTFPQETLPRQDCKSFRFGNTCCEFICLDDTLSSTSNDKTEGDGTSIAESNANYDTGLRLIASCITAVLSLSLLFFLIHRLRQRKIRVCVSGRQSRQVPEDQTSLSSMGFLDRRSLQHGGPMDDVPCGGAYPLWKPPGNYFPRGEAPPPYEEAVAAARVEQLLLSISSPNTLSPPSLPITYHQTSHSNNSTLALITNSPSGLPRSSPALSSNNEVGTLTLIPPSNRSLSSPATHSNSHQLSHSESASSGLYTGTSSCSNSNYETNACENLSVNKISNITPQHSSTSSNHCLILNSHSFIPERYQHHTNLPRQKEAFTISVTLPSSSTASHRTIPRSLATTGSLRFRRDFMLYQPITSLLDTPKNNPLEHSPRSAPPSLPMSDHTIRSDSINEDALLPEAVTSQVRGKTAEVTPLIRDYKASFNNINQDESCDSVTCTCSMQVLPTLHDDTDDYRSECENCKSATGSRYYIGNEEELVTSPHETMTLQRRPEDTNSGATPQYYRNSLTLPTSTRQRTRGTENRGNWFSSMPESSTESSDGE